jgi:hypothetical protein
MKKAKIFLYILLGLIVLGLVPIIFLNTWAMCRLWQTGRVKTPEGLNRLEEMYRKYNATPEGYNLLDMPLWKACMKENLSIGSNQFFFPTEGQEEKARTNTLDVWVGELGTKHYFYQACTPRAPRESDSRAMALPTLEGIREAIAEMNKSYSRSSKILEERLEETAKAETERALLWQELLERYDVEESELSEEQKVASFFLEYMDLENDPVWKEIQQNLKESSYYGIPWGKYVKEYGKGDDGFINFIGPSHIRALKVLTKDTLMKAQWHSILGDREKCLSELERALDLTSLRYWKPWLIDFQVRISNERIMFDAIHEIIDRNILTEVDLAGIQTRLAQINLIGDLLYCLEGEQVWCEKMIDSPAALFRPFYVPWHTSLLIRVSGMVPFSKATYRQVLWKTQDALNPEAQTVDYAAWKKALEGVDGNLNRLCWILTASFEKTLYYRTLRCQSERDVAILACALERYRMKEGSFPEKLEMLIPEYLPQMPPGSGPPAILAYRLNEEGYELRATRMPDYKSDFPLPNFKDSYSPEAVWKRSGK